MEKQIRHFFSENSEKKILPQKKGGHRGEFEKIFPGKSDITFRWVLTICYRVKASVLKMQHLVHYIKYEFLTFKMNSVFFCTTQGSLIIEPPS